MIAVIALIAASRGRLRALFRTRVAWVTLAVLAVATGAAMAWTFKTGSLDSMGSFAGEGTSPVQAFVTMVLDKSPDLGMVALFGWLDTTAPAIVYAIWSFLVLAVVLTAVIVARGRMLVAVLVSVAGFFVLPALVQAASVQTTGYIWQGRYSLLAYATVLVTSAVAIASSKIPLATNVAVLLRRAVLTLGGVAAAGQAYAVASTLRRYAVGEDAWWGAFLLHPRWQPPGSSIAWILVSLIGAGLIVLVWLSRSREQEEPRLEDTAALMVLAWIAKSSKRSSRKRDRGHDPIAVPADSLDAVE
jgi:hypothetical protein